MSNIGASILSVVPTLLALGVTVALIKTFQGKEYDLHSTHRTKSAANKSAKSLKEEGYKTRVTVEKENGKTVYAVYQRDERPFAFF